MEEITEQLVKKPSGWKWPGDQEWYVKESKYGIMRYMCPVCGKKTLGMGKHRLMHQEGCSRLLLVIDYRRDIN